MHAGTIRAYPRNAKLVQHSKLINIIFHIKDINDKEHVIISKDAQNTFSKTFNTHS